MNSSFSGLTKLFMLLAVMAITAFATRALGQKKANEVHFDSITAQRVTLVDREGHPRLVLAAPLGNPRVGGKEYPRSTPAYGFQFLDKDGNETGGLALLDNIGGGAICFDYATAEALCLTKTKDSTYITMLDPPAEGAKVGEAGAERIVISQEKGNASIVLSDHAGKNRVVLGVKSDSQAELKILDANGRPLPLDANSP
jgi:hypothetical protein